jgi:twitching motility protein PilT
MARIDPFIERLFAEQAERLEMTVGQGATIHGPRGSQALIKQPLTATQIAGAISEILPEALRSGFPRQGVTTFPYDGPAGPVEIRVEVAGAALRATIVPSGRTVGADPASAPDASSARRPASTPPPPSAPPSAARAAAARPAGARQGSIPNPPEPRGAIEALLTAMLERRASDLHLSSDSPPMLRIDGDMVSVDDYGPINGERLKELVWTLAPEKNREEWHSRKDTDFAHETHQARFRVNVFADRKGIGAVLRQIPNEILTAEKMGLSQAILDLCWLSKGLVLVTGPTGSGKSTTLAAMIDYINRNRSDHVITIEDPIEFVHPNKKCLVNQREVGVHTGSFKAALRAALREDPDVVLVGEMRDLETIAIAIETAETGHLVFGTLHTNTAPSTVDRIIDQFPADRQAQIRMMLSESLKGVLSQTLCKKIGGGRVPALEVLLGVGSVANLIREGKTFQIPSIMQTGRAAGMVTLNDALFELVKKRLVEPKEAWMKAVAKSDFKALLDRANIHIDMDA